jgi:biopolymer transport protein ExbD/biopolymer transport protein TolR
MAREGLHGRGELPMEAGINVTSLVDVAFVLLIIFMITAPIMQGGVDVQLPRTDAQPLQADQGMTVSVNQEGVIFIDEDPLTYQEFRGSFRAIVDSRQPNKVFLRGDRRALWEHVVRVLAVIRTAGIEDVGVVTEAEELNR